MFYFLFLYGCLLTFILLQAGTNWTFCLLICIFTRLLVRSAVVAFYV